MANIEELIASGCAKCRHEYQSDGCKQDREHAQRIWAKVQGMVDDLDLGYGELEYMWLTTDCPRFLDTLKREVDPDIVGKILASLI